ncbi:MAG: hypothetical protein WC043_09425 [Pseudobdellovibrionaceae bacterium]
MYSRSVCGENIGRKAFRNLIILWLGIVLFTFAAAVCVSSASAHDEASARAVVHVQQEEPYPPLRSSN